MSKNLIITYCLFLISFWVEAQIKTIDSKLILTNKNGLIENILLELEEKTGFNFAYSGEIEFEKPIEIPLGKNTVRGVLDEICKKEDLTYTVKGRQIILRKKEYKSSSLVRDKRTISGFVMERGSQETIIGANIYLPESKVGAITNTYGFYSLTLPEQDSVEVIFSFVGYDMRAYKIPLIQDVKLDVQLESGIDLEVVVVDGNYAQRESESAQMSKTDFPISHIRTLPSLLGEKDVLKVMQLMPGVQKGKEGNSGLYVRGGGPGQNLVILDDAPVYNSFHLFGFFSLFNGDALKSAEVNKGGFPARFGGRLSSVVDLNMKEGNKEKVHGSGGLGILSSRLTLEGPLVKNKASFLVSGRRTYADLFAQPFMRNKQGYYFYDFNAKFNYDINRHNKIFLSGYFGSDKLYFKRKLNNKSDKSQKGMNWGNATGTIRWNHLFNDKLFTNTSLIFSHYKFKVEAVSKFKDYQHESEYSSLITDFSLKHDWEYMINSQHSLKLGVISTLHKFTPQSERIVSNTTSENTKHSSQINSLESAVYVEDTYRPFPWLRINAGVRLSHLKAENRQYLNPEPRLSISSSLTDNFSVKASYAKMNQYIHLLTGTGVNLPTDIWVPTTDRLAPQRSEQVAVGIAKDIPEKNIIVTLEGYYKEMKNVINYKEGASFFNMESFKKQGKVSLENTLVNGQGWSYGAELLIHRKAGRLEGWMGYTLSWTQLQFDSLNFGKKFYASYDRRHDISLAGIYHLSEKVTLSGVWVYGTGNPITLPLALIKAETHSINGRSGSYQWFEDYGMKNNYRLEAYHRLDLGIQFHKKKKWGLRIWEVNIYNVYNRLNGYLYYIDKEPGFGKLGMNKISLFPIIPSISYLFKF